ncbi:ribosome biogenesis protein ytm1 [Tulasnella sp. 417]|nr:ribosome biogenesis protein ytm1 [Tulasnella sp. 417]
MSSLTGHSSTITPGTLASASATVQVKTHPVVLVTRTQYVIPTEKYMIPATWRRFHLSQLINKVLALAQPVPFDFIVNGEMLRTSLGDWCLTKGIEEEETLEIEYIESVLPPERVSSMPHPDWVSSISCEQKGYLFTGSYDSTVRLYNDGQQLLHTIGGHSGPISSICLIPPASAPTSSGSEVLVASASYDTTARIVSVPLSLPNPDDMDPPYPKPLASLCLHTSAVSSIAANASGRNLLTGGWDTFVGVWSTEIPEADEVDEVVYPTFDADRKKRRKVSKKDPNGSVRKAPQTVLKSHTNRVSSVRWSPLDKVEANVAYSCGWDFTVRCWDVEAGVCTSTLTAAEKAMLDLAITSNGKMIATANGDRTISLFQVGNPAPPTQLPHTSPVTAISAHPNSPHHIVSGCMDGTVRIWDLRSTTGAVESFVAVGDQQKAEESKAKKAKSKVLGLDWTRGNLIGCAGELGVDVWKVNIGN